MYLDEEIDESSFRSLTESMVKELVPKIGQRSKIWECIVELKNSQLLNSVSLLDNVLFMFQLKNSIHDKNI